MHSGIACFALLARRPSRSLSGRRTHSVSGSCDRSTSLTIGRPDGVDGVDIRDPLVRSVLFQTGEPQGQSQTARVLGACLDVGESNVFQ